MHELPLITMLASALAFALVLGWVTRKIGLSPIVGYLLAGIAVGPHTPGFVADADLANEFAEIGVILLMFGVGLHFRLHDLVRVWRIALPGAIAQTVTATLLGLGIALAFDWSVMSGFILGVGLAVASTVVLIRMLNSQGRVSSVEGHVAIGWLIVEDIFTVMILVILPAIKPGSELSVTTSLILAILKVGFFSLIILWLGPRFIAPFLERLAKEQSRELFILSIFVLAISVAAIAANVFHVSVALGAFLGGLVVAQSRVGDQAEADILPFRDVFSALFFVSVGMLFNPLFVIENPVMTLAALGVVLIAKPLVAIACVWVLRGSIITGLTVAIGLAQIGEFSFILATFSHALDLIPKTVFELLVTCSIFSIAVNPILARLIPYVEKKHSSENIMDKNHQEFIKKPGSSRVLVVGFGDLGRPIAQKLNDTFDVVTIIDNNFKVVENASHTGFKVHFGDAQNESILLTAGVKESDYLFVAIADFNEKKRVCELARKLSKDVVIVCFSKSEQERLQLNEAGVDDIVNLPDIIREAISEVLAFDR